MFARKGALDRHKVIHTGVKPFACTFCGKVYSQSGDLSRHKRMHHKVEYALEIEKIKQEKEAKRIEQLTKASLINNNKVKENEAIKNIKPNVNILKQELNADMNAIPLPKESSEFRSGYNNFGLEPSVYNESEIEQDFKPNFKVKEETRDSYGVTKTDITKDEPVNDADFKLESNKDAHNSEIQGADSDFDQIPFLEPKVKSLYYFKLLFVKSLVREALPHPHPL